LDYYYDPHAAPFPDTRSRPANADEVWDWPPERKVKEAFLRASKVEAVRKELAIFLDPATQWAMGAVMSVIAVGTWAAITYLTPITAGAVMALLASYGLAHQLTDIVTPFIYYLGTAVQAKSHADLDRAAKYLETAVAKGGAALLLVVICGVLQLAGRLGLKLSAEARVALARYQARADRTLRELAVLEKDVQGALPETEAGRCAWIAIARALRVLRKEGLVKVVNGQEVVTARDLAVATGTPLNEVEALSSEKILEMLVAIGIKSKRYSNVPLQNIDALVRQANGRPVLFNFRYADPEAVVRLLEATEKHRYACAWTGYIPEETLAARTAAAEAVANSTSGHSIMAYFDKKVGKTLFVDYQGKTTPTVGQAVQPYGRRPYEFDFNNANKLIFDTEQAASVAPAWEGVYAAEDIMKLLAPEVIVLEDALVMPDLVMGPTIAIPLSVIVALTQDPVMDTFFGF
jgi:hypothetical protein